MPLEIMVSKLCATAKYGVQDACHCKLWCPSSVPLHITVSKLHATANYGVQADCITRVVTHPASLHHQGGDVLCITALPQW